MSNSRALEMFQSGQGADCVIEVVPQIDGQEKQEFKVHKYVLMVNSDVFRTMFSHENTKEARESRIQITDSTDTAVHQMLVYMYTGELPSEYDIEMDAGPLLQIANKYQINSLVQLIEQGLVVSLSLKNVIDRLELADLYQIKSLYASCGKLIRSNLKMVKKEAKWMDLKKKAPELALSIFEDADEIFKTMSNKMGNSRALEMFQSGQGADCVIEVMPQINGQELEKKEFNVHKFVLMVNSDVFNAMFSHKNTKEFLDSRIIIEDSTATAVHQMLIYLYTEELPSEYATETDAGPLLHIANKYQIKALVQPIEERLVKSLSLTNVFGCVEMVDLYQMKALHSSCGLLIRRNLKTVKKEAKWLELKKKSPELAFAILEEFTDDFENGNIITHIQIPPQSGVILKCNNCGKYAQFWNRKKF